MPLHIGERGKAIAPLNITPLIDIVFQLLVFFLLTANFMTLKVIEVALPGEAVAARGKTLRQVFLVVDGSGKVSVDQRPVEVSGLAQALREVAPDPEAVLVLVDASQDLVVQKLVGVLDQVRESKIRNVQILDPYSRERLGRN